MPLGFNRFELYCGQMTEVDIYLPRTIGGPGLLPHGEVESLEARDGGVAQAVEVDAVSVVGGGHVSHLVTRVAAAPALARVQTLAGAVPPELDGGAECNGEH